VVRLGRSVRVKVMAVLPDTAVPGAGNWEQVKPVEATLGNQQFVTTRHRSGIVPVQLPVNNTAWVWRHEQSRNDCALADAEPSVNASHTPQTKTPNRRNTLVIWWCSDVMVRWEEARASAVGVVFIFLLSESCVLEAVTRRFTEKKRERITLQDV
jgi:hypothetical protein